MSELNIIKKNEGVLHLGVERPFCFIGNKILRKDKDSFLSKPNNGTK